MTEVKREVLHEDFTTCDLFKVINPEKLLATWIKWSGERLESSEIRGPEMPEVTEIILCGLDRHGCGTESKALPQENTWLSVQT